MYDEIQRIFVFRDNCSIYVQQVSSNKLISPSAAYVRQWSW